MPTDVIPSMDHVMGPLCSQWLMKIRDARKIKWERFGQYAAEGMKFYDGSADWMWRDEYATGKGGFLDKSASSGMPTFRMTVNRIFEAVALFGPALYHRNPHITVEAVTPPFIDPAMLGLNPEDPNTAQQYEQLLSQQEQQASQLKLYAKLKQHYLNWLQVEADKKTHARRSIVEAIIKGMGILWVEMYQPPGSEISYPRSTHVSVDDILIDPDAEYWEDVQWIARYCCHPINKVEEKFGLPSGALKGHMQSLQSQADTYGSSKEKPKKRRHGKSFDLVEYYDIYSKNGFGDRLRKTEESVATKLNFEPFGDFCRIVVCADVPFPLNLPTWALKDADEDDLFERVQWEVPYWTDGGWPFSRLTFYDKPRDVWPISLVKPAIGELRFINWCMSFLADKAAAASTTYVARSKQAGVEIQNQLKGGMAPFTVIDISTLTGRSVSDVISFLDAPNFNIDIWRMVAEVQTQVDKRLGLTDLVYGMSEKQMRSATEADVREQNTNIRPDDMASRVEDWLSDTAMKEMEAICWSGDRSDVEPVLGDLGASLFEQQVQTMEFDRIVRDYDYRVAAGSSRKPNKNSKQRALNELGQVILPTLQEFAGQGLVDPWNAYISEVADTMDIDATAFIIELPEQEEEEGPSPEEVQMQIEQQMAELEMQVKQQQIELDAMQAEQELEQDSIKFEQELDQSREKSQVELLLSRAKLGIMRQEAEIRADSMQELADIKVESDEKIAEQKLAAARKQAQMAGQNRNGDSS